MFPALAVEIRGLKPRVMYNLVLEFHQKDSHKWKYQDGEWQPGANSEPPSQPVSQRNSTSKSAQLNNKYVNITQQQVLTSRKRFQGCIFDSKCNLIQMINAERSSHTPESPW